MYYINSWKHVDGTTENSFLLNKVNLEFLEFCLNSQ